MTKKALFELRILATKARVCINDSFESKTVRDDSSSVRNTHVRQVLYKQFDSATNLRLSYLFFELFFLSLLTELPLGISSFNNVASQNFQPSLE